MLKNYFKTAFRNLQRQLGYSLINLLGLSLGIAAAFVILLYVVQELTYDHRFENSDRIYRVATDFYDMGGFAKSQAQLLDHLPTEAPDIDLVTRLDRGFQETAVTIGNQDYVEPYYFYVDSAYFKMFSYSFLAGSPETVMRTPDEVVLTETLARKYFGDTQVLGRVIRIGKEKTPYRVSGVVADVRDKTHLRADFWLPLELEEPDGRWTNASYYNYVRLRSGSTETDLEEGLQGVLQNQAYPASGSDAPFETWLEQPQAVRFWVQPLTDIYLHSDFKFEIGPGGNPTQIYIMGIIGLFIIFIAGVNYINLTTARSSIRAKEIGMRKALGAERRMLVGQFLTETVVFSLLAMALAAGLAEVVLGVFAYVTGSVLVESIFTDPGHILALLAFSVLVGLAAGLYPAFYLSGFRPIKILKGSHVRTGNRPLRSALVVVQFGIATALIIGSLVVYRQLDFMLHTDKGFEHEGVLVIESVRALGNQVESFRQELEQRPQVAQTSFAARVPTGSGIWMYTYKTPEMQETTTMQTFPIDENFIPTLGMRLVAGRNFSRDLASDSSAAIINEAAVAAFNLGDDPIGKEINEGQRVVGVVGDFNFQSLRTHIAPVVLTYTPSGSKMIVRLEGRDIADFMDQLQILWSRFSPDDPVPYNFLDDNFAQLTAQESTLGKAISFFTLLALIIACVGLFALSAFTAEQRTKEIGIRKVLGASIVGIVGLLSKDFLKLVLIAFGLAVPLVYLALNRWLEDFAYHVDLQAADFILTGGVILLVAFVTVSYQSIRTAMANPVEALRYE